MGLLDMLGSDVGLLGLNLMAAGSAKPVRTGFGEGLLQSLQAVQAQRDREKDRAAQEQDRAQRKAMQDMQMQQILQATEARKKAAEQEQTRQGYLGSIDPSQGPAMPISTPRALAAGLSLPEIGALTPKQRDPMAGFDKVSPKDYTPESLAAFVQTGNPAVLRASPKEEAATSSIKDYQFAVSQGYKGTFEQWDTSRKRAGASNVNVGDRPPAGYRWNAAGGLDPIPGGPADKLPEKQQNTVVGVQNLRSGISEYRNALKSFGGFDALSPDARARMGTKYNNMMLQAKEAYNLGVLNGPDLEILTSVITDPRSVTGAFTSKKALDDQAKELDRIMAKIADVASQTRPRGSPEQPAGNVVNFGDLK